MRTWNSLETLWQDLRYALRMMRRTPGFTAVAVLSLALGIGANTAIFSLIDTLMLRMLPVREPGQLVDLMQKYPGEPRGNGYWTFQSYQHFRDHSHVFSELIATSRNARLSVRSEGFEPETLIGEYVVGNFFTNLGVTPLVGRLIGREDEAAGGVAVVSWSYWKNRLQMDPAILGKRITVDNVPVTVVGVAPRAFVGLVTGARTDVWLPRKPSADMGLILIGRMKPGVSIEQVRAEMPVLYRFTIEERARDSKDPVVRQLKVEVEPAGAGLSPLRDRYGKPLLLIMAVVGLLLLIACTNVASMLLARGAARQREMAVRVSLGAGRLRLVRQVLTESLLLSAAGTALGVVLAYWCTGVLVRIIANGRAHERVELQVSPDWNLLLFTAGAAVLAGILFGLAPALHAFASAPASSLRQTGRAGETRFLRFFGKGLVSTQVAISVVLLSAAGLFVLHLSNLRNVGLGFQRNDVLLVTLDPARSGYNRQQLSRSYQELLGRLAAIPGVRAATLSGVTPISGAGASRFVTVEGHREKPEERRYISLNWVAPKYFETLGTPLLAGRDFNFEDQGRPRVAIVNQTMARYYFGGGPAIGKHVTIDRDPRSGGWYGDDRPYEIVGVVGDAKYYELRETPGRTMYFNAFQEGRIQSQFVIRTSIKPAAVAIEVRRTVGELLKTVAVARITTLEEQVDASIVPERLSAMLAGLFGVLGSVLAAIGLYGLLAYTVARRINEIGIRMALGATRGDVVRMVLRDAMAMVCAGLAIGVPIALWARRLAGNLIRDLPVESVAPIFFGAVAMLAVALVAAYLPARRAARVDPMEALRYE